MHPWERLLDEARSDAQAQARERERWLRRQATESATMVGTLLDLAESDVPLAISVLGGRRHDGRVVGLATDVVVLLDRGEHVAVRIDAIAVARPAPGAAGVLATGDRPAALDVGFTELLGRLVDEQPDVAIAFRTGDSLTGQLVAVGADVLTIRVAAGPDGIAYCSPTAVSSIRFRSG